MTSSPSGAAERAARFYDEWSSRFLSDFGTTLQAGLVKRGPDDPEDAATSAQLLAERAGVTDGERLLDAGCGFGGPAAAIAGRFPRCSIAGVTISRAQARAAVGVTGSAGVAARVEVVLGDYHHLPFADRSFDRVLFLESIGYSDDHERLFAEAARVTRAGGTIYVKDVFAPAAGITETQRATLDRFDAVWHLAASPTFDEVTTALRRAGCRIVGSGELPHVGTASFMAAMVEPDPDTLFRLTDLGERFAMRTTDLPLVFGEVTARVT